MLRTVISILSSLVIVTEALSVSNNQTKGVNEMSRKTIFGEGAFYTFLFVKVVPVLGALSSRSRNSSPNIVNITANFIDTFNSDPVLEARGGGVPRVVPLR